MTFSIAFEPSGNGAPPRSSRRTELMHQPAGSDHLCLPPHFPSSPEPLVIPVDKPGGSSSFKVVRRLRSILGIRKIGHTGTLDPMATGLLICLTGRATKRMEHYMMLPKEYSGTLRLGETTASYDAEMPVLESRPTANVTDEDLVRAAASFEGEIEQLPPMYSAVKVGGERLYKKARRGESLARPPRCVSVHEFTVEARRGPDVPFRIRCSRGTYIRSLAHDLGQVLGCGAHLIALRRTAIGPIRVEEAWVLQELEEAVAGITGQR